MRQSYGGLSINANTTPFLAPLVATKYTQGWEAHGVSQHGDGSVTPSAASSRLTLAAGVYEIEVNLVPETETVAGTSGDATGIVTFQLAKAGTVIPGAKAKMDAQAADRPQTVAIKEIVEITPDNVDDGENYVELYCSGGDANGNDIVISDGRFFAKRLA